MSLFIPDDPRPVHFVGIAGSGMSALALIARSRGVSVTGCDTNAGAAEDLVSNGVTVLDGHDVGHVSGVRAIIYTAAVPPDLPELVAAREHGIPVVRRADALADAVQGGTTVGIAGTHGKTSTTVMATMALQASGLDPTGIVGGRVAEWHGNATIGGRDLFVVEADEYDRAFLALTPDIAVINNVEADHLECYGSLESLEAAFVEFASRASRVLIGADDRGAVRVAKALKVPTWRVGLAANADFCLGDVQRRPEGSKGRLRLPDGSSMAVELAVPGLHNLRNAAMAVGAAVALGADARAAAKVLRGYRGVGRRFEVLGSVDGVTVVDDYAHHATELAATLAAARQRFPGQRLIAVFQPHLYSRTRSQSAQLGIVLSTADVVVVTEIYPAREAPVPGVTGESVVKAARRAGAEEVEWVPELALLPEVLSSLVRKKDVVITLGAGNITEVGPKLLQRLSGAAA